METEYLTECAQCFATISKEQYPFCSEQCFTVFQEHAPLKLFVKVMDKARKTHKLTGNKWKLK